MIASTAAASDDAAATRPVLLEARGLYKSFGGVAALQDLDITFGRGEVTAIVGDNGAGKSTLIRCLTGVHPPDKGSILYRGEPVRLHSPDAARRLGIETVYQDLALIEDLQVWQNLFLNREIFTNVLGLHVLRRRRMMEESKTILTRLDVTIPSVRTTVRRMSGGQRQSIAIARAANWGETLVVMDEPTAALGVRETRAVEKIITNLRAAGVTVAIISHDLAQVQRIADTVWVLRRGSAVARRSVGETSGDELVGLITGVIAGDADA